MIETVSNQELETRLRQHLHRLPIFPLYRVSLFPHALLPLYVFEPRYREMTEHCLSAGGSMAIATLLPGHEAEYQGRPPVRLIAGAGQVVAHRKNPDGTFNILLQGVARVRIDEELPPERAFREKEQTLTAKLKEVQEQLSKLEAGGEAGAALLSESDRHAIERFRADMLNVRRDLREVKRELREDIDKLNWWLQMFNIAFVPLLIGASGIAFAIMRRRSSSASSAAKPTAGGK